MERSLAKQAKDSHPGTAKLFEAMRYALLGGGKRLRPLLSLAAAEAVGGRQREALPAAMAVEAIHAYSLIHDDLPCMDDDDLRRGRPTCHKIFGESTALLAGDALLTLAFEFLAGNGVKSLEAGRRINSAALHLARAAGAVGMVGGQVLDLAFENSGNRDIEEVRFMAARKTGDLIAAALVCGSALAGGSPSELKTLRALGHHAGLAFQIKDDLLNLTGDPKVMGKAKGSDAEHGKSSFPALLGEEGAERELRALAEKALAAAASFKLRGRNLRFLILRMVNRER
ncbi:MAG: polyprenyl synthetase family protein [Candidatus Adiutrix sp.]|nr:polyprenyl synthetase family protein [Candidatus Adiutrix sp.]